MIKLMQAGS